MGIKKFFTDKFELSTHSLFIVGALLLLFRILLGRFVGMWFYPIMYHDDALLIRYADFHNHFIEQTLPFNDALLKNIGFSLFLNLVNWSTLQYVEIIAILWGLAAILSVLLFTKVTEVNDRKVHLLIYTFVLFAPVAFDSWCGSRLYRSSAMTPLYFIVLNMLAILFVQFFKNLKIHPVKFIAFQIILGLIFTLTFYIKEDGIWLLACLVAVFVLCFGKIIIQKNYSW